MRANQAKKLMPSIFTIGHSNRDAETVIGMLKAAGADMLADVRAFPRSRSNPAFNIDSFPDLLDEHGIAYKHFDKLGGRRKRQEDVNPALNGLWRVQSFHNYADYALSGEFQSAIDNVVSLADDCRVALMCSEAVWWRCHRRIIADHLMARGHEIIHLMAPDRQEQAKLTEGAVVSGSTGVVYPNSEYLEEPNEHIPLCRYERLATRENKLRARRADQPTRSSSSPDETSS